MCPAMRAGEETIKDPMLRIGRDFSRRTQSASENYVLGQEIIALLIT